MEYVKAMEIRERMCMHNLKNSCAECQFDTIRNSKNTSCISFILKHPAESEAILTKWDAENPVKTMMDDFFEKHPNAPKNENGSPTLCPCQCGYVLASRENCEYANGDCLKCWSRPLQEESK